jgi:release factor H-coupled RctB family protein
MCEDRDLLLQESLDAHNAIERSIADLVDFGLARVVAAFRPVVTFKTTRSHQRRRAQDQRR